MVLHTKPDFKKTIAGLQRASNRHSDPLKRHISNVIDSISISSVPPGADFRVGKLHNPTTLTVYLQEPGMSKKGSHRIISMYIEKHYPELIYHHRYWKNSPVIDYYVPANHDILFEFILKFTNKTG